MILTASELISAAKANCNCLDADRAKSFCNDNPDALIVDVREPAEYEKSHLPAAINIPRGLLEMRIADTCPDANHPILIHCGAGGRASLSAHTLQTMGYANIHVVDAAFPDLLAVFAEEEAT